MGGAADHEQPVSGGRGGGGGLAAGAAASRCFAGVLADRRDKLALVRITQSLLLCEATLLWWFNWTGHVTIAVLIGIALFGGTASAFDIPTRQSLMVELVGRDDVVDAIALNSSGFNLARIVGPEPRGGDHRPLRARMVLRGECTELSAGAHQLFRIKLPKKCRAHGAVAHGGLDGGHAVHAEARARCRCS